MNFLKKTSLAIIAIYFPLLFSGCGDENISSQAISKIKQMTTKDALPENDITEAINAHGFAYLLDLATQGNPKAERLTAIAYLGGMGVPKNYDEADKWALRAANHGDVIGAFLKGVLEKDAIETDNLALTAVHYVKAYIWLSISAAGGHPPAGQLLNKLESNEFAPIISHAQKLAADWRPCQSISCRDQDLNVGTPLELLGMLSHTTP